MRNVLETQEDSKVTQNGEMLLKKEVLAIKIVKKMITKFLFKKSKIWVVMIMKNRMRDLNTPFANSGVFSLCVGEQGSTRIYR